MYYLFEAGVDGDKIRIQNGDYDLTELSAALQSVEIEKAVLEIYRSLIPKEKRREFPTLVYVPSIEILKHTTQCLKAALEKEGVRITSWDGDMSNDRLTREIKEMKEGKLDIVVLCEMGGRGLNLPRVRCVIDAFATLSANKLEQRDSRTLRRIRDGSIDKKFAIIAQIIPQSSRFRPITLLDIIGGWERYSPGTILGIDTLSAGLDSRSGEIFTEGAEMVAQFLRSLNLKSNIRLVEEVNMLHEIRLREKLPRVDETGFFVLKGKRYGTIERWGQVLPVSRSLVKTKLEEAGVEGITGRLGSGAVLKNSFYAEDDVVRVCADYMPESAYYRADAKGFFNKDGEIYGTLSSWSRKFEEEGTSVDPSNIKKHLAKIGAVGISGRNANNTMEKDGFFREQDVRTACKELLVPMPQADKDGFFEKEGRLYGTPTAWEKLLVGISKQTIERSLKKGGFTGISGKASNGSPFTFFSETDVVTACQEIILASVNMADENNVLTVNGIEHRTIYGWSRALDCEYPAKVARRLEAVKHKGIMGRNNDGQIRIFLPKTVVRDCCADLMDEKNLPAADATGFFMSDGKRYGTIGAWGRVIPYVEQRKLRNDLRKKSKQAIRGRWTNNNFGIFYAEEDVYDVLKNRMPKVEQSGFFTVRIKERTLKTMGKVLFDNKDVKYGTLEASLKMSMVNFDAQYGIRVKAYLLKLMERKKIIPISALDQNGEVTEAIFYPSERILKLVEEARRGVDAGQDKTAEIKERSAQPEIVAQPKEAVSPVKVEGPPKPKKTVKTQASAAKPTVSKPDDNVVRLPVKRPARTVEPPSTPKSGAKPWELGRAADKKPSSARFDADRYAALAQRAKIETNFLNGDESQIPVIRPNDRQEAILFRAGKDTLSDSDIYTRVMRLLASRPQRYVVSLPKGDTAARTFYGGLDGSIVVVVPPDDKDLYFSLVKKVGGLSWKDIVSKEEKRRVENGYDGEDEKDDDEKSPEKDAEKDDKKDDKEKDDPETKKDFKDRDWQVLVLSIRGTQFYSTKVRRQYLKKA